MIRRILACLALITGLAAIGSPAEARLVLDISQQVENGAGLNQAIAAAPCAPVQARLGVPAKAADVPPCRPRKAVVIYLPTVQLGTDRARE